MTLPLLARCALPWLARGAAKQLDKAAQEIAEAMPDEPAPLPLLPEAQEVAALDEATPEASAAPKSNDEPLPPATGLMVPRARVEAAAQAGHRPSGYGVASTPWRPAGMALSGVGGVGIGLRDGDVVTRVGGTPATSVGAVTGAVRAAIRKGQPAIVAEVWRGRRKIIVTVELPQDSEG